MTLSAAVVATVTMEVKKIISWFINITKCCLDFGAVGGGGGLAMTAGNGTCIGRNDHFGNKGGGHIK